MPGKASSSGRENTVSTSVSRIDFSHATERLKETKLSSTATSENEAFNSFVAEFDTSKLNHGVGDVKLGKGGSLDIEIESLREQLKRANMEKDEITSKYEKHTATCRSQRQEIQELKQALAARTPSPDKDYLKNQSSNQQSGCSQLQRNLFDQKPANPEPKTWQAFAEDTNSPTSSASDHPKSVGLGMVSQAILMVRWAHPTMFGDLVTRVSRQYPLLVLEYLDPQVRMILNTFGMASQPLNLQDGLDSNL